MAEETQAILEFVSAILKGTGLNLQSEFEDGQSDATLLNFTGTDTGLLRADNGELLDAIEHLINQVFNSRTSGEPKRIICDVEGFRAIREAELKAMARHAASIVRSSGKAFTFAPMNSNERRMIHLALSEESDLVTESIGQGTARRLCISLKP
ncbi:MAG: protein jag [Pyrinomonadaceae bacterium]